MAPNWLSRPLLSILSQQRVASHKPGFRIHIVKLRTRLLININILLFLTRIDSKCGSKRCTTNIHEETQPMKYLALPEAPTTSSAVLLHDNQR